MAKSNKTTQPKTAAKAKKSSRVFRFVLFLVIAVGALAIAFHMRPLFFIELIESAL